MPPPGSDSATLLEPRVPSAIAGDSGWKYQQRATADFDGDGIPESAVLIADVALDARGIPMWEHGHRWQVYFEEPDDSRTRAYARFLPNGKLTADVAVPRPGGSATPTVTLLEQTPFTVAVYEIAYRTAGRVEVLTRFERAVDPARAFAGAPRP